ncbi:MAG TPA: lysylphosphatidylglycerol synthase transmembrane domain-containing protein [Gemmatimonadaceae bacterium]|nr:lysylphosphatidylglycerol synthase transmembrane domain-containing protein [Gemmatimonadaceae bacterium]
MTPRHRAALVLAWLVATFLLVVCARSIEWTRAIELAATARPGWLAVSVVANAAILTAWAAFWRTLVPRGDGKASYARMFEVVSVASALMNTVPFGGGHASSVVLLARRAGTTHKSALSVMALDQLGEGIAKVLAFLLVALIVPLPAWMRASITTVSLAVGAWFVALMIASRWAAGLEVLKDARRSALAMCCVLAMKAAEVVGIVAVQHAFGIAVPFGGTLLVFAALVLATMLPVAPANLGTYEAAAFVAYRYLGLAPEQALGLAVVQHVCFLIPTAGLGYAFMSARTFSRSAMASQ